MIIRLVNVNDLISCGGEPNSAIHKAAGSLVTSCSQKKPLAGMTP